MKGCFDNGVDFRLGHKAKKGETRCMYCRTEHCAVKLGKCPAFDAVRPPQTGELFVGVKGDIVRARFDFAEQSFPVLHPGPEELIMEDHGLEDIHEMGFCEDCGKKVLQVPCDEEKGEYRCADCGQITKPF